jgi:hypothetical protein
MTKLSFSPPASAFRLAVLGALLLRRLDDIIIVSSFPLHCRLEKLRPKCQLVAHAQAISCQGGQDRETII